MLAPDRTEFICAILTLRKETVCLDMGPVNRTRRVRPSSEQRIADVDIVAIVDKWLVQLRSSVLEE